MAEQSTTPDLVELERSRVDAFARGDYDLESLTPDAVYDASRFELGVHAGPTWTATFWKVHNSSVSSNSTTTATAS